MPSGKNYIRNYKQEYATAKKRKEIPEIMARNRNRTEAVKEGRVKPGDGKDISHKKALSKGGSNSKSNLRVQDASTNRSFKRKSDGSMK